MRTIVIADCHGNPKLISNALEHAGFDRDKDDLVFAGDFLDIGPDPLWCLDLLVENDANILWGNHELAIILKQAIHPQSGLSWKFYDILIQMVPEWDVMAAVDGVLISHAGLSQVYERSLWKELKSSDPAQAIADNFNERFRMVLSVDNVADDFWAEDSPLWYRPGLLMPIFGMTQVVGHTPPESWMLNDFPEFHMIDPYARAAQVLGVQDTRYRYAIIENGSVTVVDSMQDSKITFV